MTHRGYRALLLIAAARRSATSSRSEMIAVFADSEAERTAPARSACGSPRSLEVLGLSARLRFDQLRTDLRHSVRGLLRQKTFTLTAVTTLALALGPTTAVFSLVNGVLLDPLPGRDRISIACVYAWAAESRTQPPRVPVERAELRRSSRAQAGPVGARRLRLDQRDDRRRRAAAGRRRVGVRRHVRRARHRAWRAAGASPPTTCSRARRRRIILGHDFAQTRFPGGDAVGQTLMVDGRSTAIIGVLPEGFRFPAGEANFWQPLDDRSRRQHAQPDLPAHDGPARRRRDDRASSSSR